MEVTDNTWLPRTLRRVSFIVLTFGLVGCASLISQGALSPPMLNLDLLEDEQMSAIGYQSDQFCSQQPLPSGETQQLCLAYLQAPAYHQSSREAWRVEADRWADDAPFSTRAMEVQLRFWPGQAVAISPMAGDRALVDSVATEDNIVMSYVIELNTTRGDDVLAMVLDHPVADTTKGTYVLVHGFRTNKESLFFVAEALRYHGYDVVLVDLFGHGQSEGNFSFSGKPDAQAISQLIDALEISTPLHLLGMSMGGTTSTHLAKLRDDVTSLTLLAPMLEFADAFVDAGRAYTRTAHLVPQSSLYKGAEYALNEAGTSKEDTAVVNQVAELNIPVLIMGSSNDKISPLSKLEGLHGGQVMVHSVEPRTHHGMILWDTEDVVLWHEWVQRAVNSYE